MYRSGRTWEYKLQVIWTGYGEDGQIYVVYSVVNTQPYAFSRKNLFMMTLTGVIIISYILVSRGDYKDNMYLYGFMSFFSDIYSNPISVSAISFTHVEQIIESGDLLLWMNG